MHKTASRRGCRRRTRGSGCAPEYFWCGKRRRRGDDARRGLKAAGDPRDAEVRQLGFAIVGEQNVRGFDVAVQGAQPMAVSSAPAILTPM